MNANDSLHHLMTQYSISQKLWLTEFKILHVMFMPLYVILLNCKILYTTPLLPICFCLYLSTVFSFFCCCCCFLQVTKHSIQITLNYIEASLAKSWDPKRSRNESFEILIDMKRPWKLSCIILFSSISVLLFFLFLLFLNLLLSFSLL